MLSFLFLIVIMILLFVGMVILTGVSSIVQVWRNIFGPSRRRNQGPASGAYSSTRQESSSASSDGPVILDGGTSHKVPTISDMGSVKDVEYEKIESE